MSPKFQRSINENDTINVTVIDPCYLLHTDRPEDVVSAYVTPCQQDSCQPDVIVLPLGSDLLGMLHSDWSDSLHISITEGNLPSRI